jgi:hypothetical protein
MAVSDTPGRGKKLCPNCQKYIGARSAKCENCGTEFSIKTAIDSEPKIEEHNSSTSMSRMFIQGFRKVAYPGVMPNDQQPPRLKGTSKAEVQAWMPKVMAWGHERQVDLMPSALRYLVRGVYDYKSAEYQEVCSRLNDSYDEYDDVDDEVEAFGESVKQGEYTNPDCEDHAIYVDGDIPQGKPCGFQHSTTPPC